MITKRSVSAKKNGHNQPAFRPTAATEWTDSYLGTIISGMRSVTAMAKTPSGNISSLVFMQLMFVTRLFAFTPFVLTNYFFIHPLVIIKPTGPDLWITVQPFRNCLHSRTSNRLTNDFAKVAVCNDWIQK
jgi:hypothetical protein